MEENESTTTETNGNHSIIDDFVEADLTIETTDTSLLIQQLQDAPSTYWDFAKKLEAAKRLVADIKLRISVKETEIAKRLRSVDSSISEAKVNRLLYDDQEYIKLNQILNMARSQEGKLAAFVRALEHRQSIMLAVVGLIRAELRQQI